MPESEPAHDCPLCDYAGDQVNFDPLEPGQPHRCPECSIRMDGEQDVSCPDCGGVFGSNDDGEYPDACPHCGYEP